MKKASYGWLLPLFATVLAGCSGSSETATKITLTVWEDDTNIDMLTNVADEFSAWYANQFPLAPRVEITFVPESEGKAVSNLILDGPSGNGPDIVAFVHDTLGTAVNNGLLSPVLNPEDITAHNSTDSVRAFTYEDTLYAYPYVAESITLMYNAEATNASELASFEALSASGKKIALTMTGDGSGYYGFGILNDTVLFGADGTESTQLNLATDDAVHNLYTVLHDYSDAIIDTDPDTALALMGTGEVVGVVSAPYLWDSVKTNFGANAALATLPTINGEAERPFSGYKGYGVSRYSKYPTVAHLFANYLTTEDSQYYRFRQKGYLPTYIGSDLIDSHVDADSAASIFKASLAQSIPMPNILAMADYWSPMQDAMTALWNAKGSSITEAFVRTTLEDATTTILS